MVTQVIKRSASELPPADLYEEDFFAWTQDQAEKLRARSLNAVDWDNLAEEIDSVGRSQTREIANRLVVLLTHLLKWQFQPARRSHSWQSSIGEQRIHIAGVIEDSPSLKSFPQDTIGRAYGHGLRKAHEETGLALSVFPGSCPWSVEDVLDSRFMPGEPWSPDELIRD